MLNSPVAKPVRSSFWIQSNRHIVKITPDTYTEHLGGNRFRTRIYATNQYAQGLRKNYRFLWEAIHAFDMRFANRFMPAWNMGFDTFQPDETASNDTYIQQDNATTNFGSSTTLSIGEVTGATGARQKGLIKFDFSTIPAGSTLDVNGTVFTIKTAFTASETNASTVSMYQLLRDWVELQATYNIWKTANNWTTAGAAGDGTDADLTNAWGSYSITAGELLNVTKTITVNATGLAVLQNMVNGSVANYGMLFDTPTTNCSHIYYSSGAATAGNRPKLDMTYALPAGGFFPFFFA